MDASVQMEKSDAIFLANVEIREEEITSDKCSCLASIGSIPFFVSQYNK